ncbi:hypothetical protein [Aestuariivivens insulae]|nr:hypothetical protein [Aestuariivivens insulae]
MKHSIMILFFLFYFEFMMPQAPNMVVDVIEEGFIYERAIFPQCHAPTLVELNNGHIMDHAQMLCLSINLGQSEKEELGVFYASKLSPEGLDLCIERFRFKTGSCVYWLKHVLTQ